MGHALPLPSVSPMSVNVVNAMTTRDVPWRIPVGKGFGLLAPDPFAVPCNPALTLLLAVGGRPWTVSLGDADVVRRHPALKDVPPENTLDDELVSAVAAAMTEPILGPLGRLLGATVVLKDVIIHHDGGADTDLADANRASPLGRVAMTLSLPAGNGLPETTVPVRIDLPSAEDAQALADRILSLPPIRKDASRFDDVPFPVSRIYGSLTLDVATLRSLEAGDILFPTDINATADVLVYRLPTTHGGLHSIRLSVDDGTATVLEPPVPIEEESMSEEDETATREQVEVQMRFELDRRLMTIADLATLAPGYTFALDADPAGTGVTLVVNGKSIGRGRLIDAGGVPGVQITEIR